MGEKKTFFCLFFSFSHFHIETKLFCFDQNLYSSIPIFDKNWPQGANKIVFSDFFFVFRSSHRYETFFFTKISYLQQFRDFMGGQEKALHQRQQRQRTKWTIIIPRQDSFRIIWLLTLIVQELAFFRLSIFSGKV